MPVSGRQEFMAIVYLHQSYGCQYMVFGFPFLIWRIQVSQCFYLNWRVGGWELIRCLDWNNPSTYSVTSHLSISLHGHLLSLQFDNHNTLTLLPYNRLVRAHPPLIPWHLHSISRKAYCSWFEFMIWMYEKFYCATVLYHNSTHKQEQGGRRQNWVQLYVVYIWQTADCNVLQQASLHLQWSLNAFVWKTSLRVATPGISNFFHWLIKRGVFGPDRR